MCVLLCAAYTSFHQLSSVSASPSRKLSARCSAPDKSDKRHASTQHGTESERPRGGGSRIGEIADAYQQHMHEQLSYIERTPSGGSRIGKIADAYQQHMHEQHHCAVHIE
ncbi:hypothetical protein JKP88DRAFT_245968 [Tribonema minus]|uniref:Uncharacterized protein n=1 Tax=Tribonema minus TaxID=303371 RepID=A0A836CE50_9STRA|nr:hypothetical protein JKP88DRAFT_245968 [Tribonema minus]